MLSFLSRFLVMSVLSTCLFAMTPAMAGDTDLEKTQEKVDQSLKKFGRGVGNTLAGWLEVPINVKDINETRGEIAAGTYGVARGLVKGFTRTVVGIGEVFTMYKGHDPIIEPEFVGGENGIVWTIFGVNDTGYNAKADEWKMEWPKNKYKALVEELEQAGQVKGLVKGKLPEMDFDSELAETKDKAKTTKTEDNQKASEYK